MVPPIGGLRTNQEPIHSKRAQRESLHKGMAMQVKGKKMVSKARDWGLSSPKKKAAIDVNWRSKQKNIKLFKKFYSLGFLFS